MPEDLAAGPVTLSQLLQSEREYHSPLFQRRYVWTKEDHTRLWSDIVEILDGEETVRFLGAVVLEARPVGLATDPVSYWIIDGQQRLTTLYLALVNLAFVAHRHGDEALADDILRIYLLNQSGSARNQPKVRPTLLDQRQFNDAFKALNFVEPRLPVSYGDETGRLSTANQTLRRLVRERVVLNKEYSHERATELLSKLVGSLKFVQIILADKIDPNQVFDSLNTTGQRLENKDLIRNEIFHKLSDKPQEAEALHRNKWVPFEQHLGERLDGYFFPFVLIHSPSATKSSVLSELRTRWKEKSSLETITDVQTYAAAYDAFTSPAIDARESLRCSAELREAADRLRRSNAPSSVLPFVMRVLDEVVKGELSDAAGTASIRLVESFLVRRAFVGLEPTGLHAVFKTMWQESLGDHEKVLATIRKNQTISMPDDAEFRAAVRGAPLYRRKICHYVLVEFERGLKGGDPLPADLNVTADHILPQKVTGVWEDVFDKDSHAEWVDSWANLVPLSQKVNSEKSRQSWSDVQQIFKTEQYFKTTKRLAESVNEWTVATLEARSEALANWALIRWPM